MNKSVNIYDQRQFRLMLEKVHLFRENKIELNHMLSSILALASMLKNENEADLNKFLDFEGKIDYFFLNLNDNSLDEKVRSQSKTFLENELDNLEKYIESKVDKNLTDEDVEYKY